MCRWVNCCRRTLRLIIIANDYLPINSEYCFFSIFPATFDSLKTSQLRRHRWVRHWPKCLRQQSELHQFARRIWVWMQNWIQFGQSVERMRWYGLHCSIRKFAPHNMIEWIFRYCRCQRMPDKQSRLFGHATMRQYHWIVHLHSTSKLWHRLHIERRNRTLWRFVDSHLISEIFFNFSIFAYRLDDDECILNRHNCVAPYECRNTKGSFRCDRPRYTTTTPPPTTTTLRTTTTPRPYVHTHTYTSTPVRYTITAPYGRYTAPAAAPTSPISRYGEWDTRFGPCNVGFQRSTQGACVDIDECNASNPCRRNQRCMNTNGSYKCVNLLTCSGGFTSNNEGTQCIGAVFD